MVCEAIGEDTDFKNVRRLVAVAEGSSLYAKLVNLQKDQRGKQTILTGQRRIVMLLKLGEENMKIDLENGRRSSCPEMEERLKIYMQLMDTEGKQEDVKFDVKMFF